MSTPRSLDDLRAELDRRIAERWEQAEDVLAYKRVLTLESRQPRVRALAAHAALVQLRDWLDGREDA